MTTTTSNEMTALDEPEHIRYRVVYGRDEWEVVLANEIICTCEYRDVALMIAAALQK